MTQPNGGVQKQKPYIVPTVNGPYQVQYLKDMKNSRDETIETFQEMYLCRCGGSSHKPFCDRTHLTNGFSGAKADDRVPDKIDHYRGRGITIHDNRGVCAHSGCCSDNLPKVFQPKNEPWIDPDAARPDEIAKTIRMCPSGALSCSMDGEEYKNQDREPNITVTRNGPYAIVGGPNLDDPAGCQPESIEHYTLCRCGGSKNKPFCSGQHWYNNFTDDKN